jgi:hypothetical protein
MGAFKDRVSQTAQKVTLAEAKALGFESTKGITKSGGVYNFDTSLAPDRGGFQSVGVAKPGQVQMTPYYGDVTGAYRLTQEQFGSVYNPNDLSATSAGILKTMSENKARAGGGGSPIIVSGGSLGSASITATPAVPEITPAMRMFSVETAPVKTAPIDTVLFDEEAVPIEVMADLIFEDIGGQELLSITRSDIVNGQKISYQPIKNLSAIQQQYNPNNILGLQKTSDKFFAGFAIKLENKIPEEGNGANGNNVYLNELGDLVIEFINLNNDEQVETQITTSGTIYEADLGEYAS